MALRYQLPSLGQEIGVKKELCPLPMGKTPVPVGFRRGADLRRVANEVLENKAVRLEAAVGSGKSVRMPSALALVSQGVVFHVTPNPLLALSLHTHVSKLANEGDAGIHSSLFLWDDVDMELPASGVVFAGAPVVMAKLLKTGMEFLKGAVLFMDEAHESDAFTYVLQRVVVASALRTLVLASATFEPTGFRKRETPSQVAMKTFMEELPAETWEPEDVGKPWSVMNISENVCVFIDSNTQAKRVTACYHDAGFSVARLTSRSTREDYLSAMAMMADKYQAALILDYSFRSGFTFNVSTIIDSGYVMYVDATTSVPTKKHRKIFEFEAEQTAGRGGRIVGMNADYFCPDFKLDKKMCILDGVEVDAAALLLRCLGYKPTKELSGSPMAFGKTPADVGVALAGLIPLNCLSQEQYERVTSVTSSPMIRTDSEETVFDTVAAAVETATASSQLKEAVKPVVDADQQHKVTLVDQLAEVLEGTAVSLVEGVYYYAPDTDGMPTCTVFLPRGYRSVKKLMDSDTFASAALGMSKMDRGVATVALLDRYNELNIELEAVSTLLKTSPLEAASLSKAKTFLLDLLEVAGAMESERNCCIQALSVLVSHGAELAVFQGLPDVVSAKVDAYRAMMQDIPLEQSVRAYQDKLKAVVRGNDFKQIGADNASTTGLIEEYEESQDDQMSVANIKKKKGRHRHLRYNSYETQLPKWTCAEKLVERVVDVVHDELGKRELVEQVIKPSNGLGRLIYGRNGFKRTLSIESKV